MKNEIKIKKPMGLMIQALDEIFYMIEIATALLILTQLIVKQ